MLLVARKNLFSEKIRLAISVGGVALSVFLISLLLSLFRGWSEKVGGFVEDTNVDIWVAKAGTADFLSSASFLITEEGANQFRSIPGLQESVPPSIEASFDPGRERWSPLIVRPMTAEAGNKKIDVTLVGYSPSAAIGEPIGGPIRIVEGAEAPGPGQVIVDEALSKRYGVGIGELLSAAGKDWKVVGISAGGDFVAAQVIFVPFRDAQDVLTMRGFTTYFALALKDPAERHARAIEIAKEHPDVVAIAGDDFAEATRDRILSDVVPILLVVLGVSFIVGLAVAGLTIYTATVEKSREYGILKAVGFTNGYLYRLVIEQSLLTASLGFVIGFGLTVILGPVARDMVPQFVVFVRWQDVLLVAAATIVIAALAAYVPVRRLASIDPTSVFRG